MDSRRQSRALLITGLLLACPLLLLAAPPASIQALLDAKKYDEANQKIPALVEAASGSSRLELIRLAFDTDPNITRLKKNLQDWTAAESEPGSRSVIARLLAQLCLLQRDYPGALAAYDYMVDDPEAILRSSGLLLLMGNGATAKNRLVTLLKQTTDVVIIERASCLLAWLVWADGDPKTGLEILKDKKTPAALYLTSVLARTLGLKKEDQAARDRLLKDWPHSIWVSLAEPDADPAIQMETSLLILTGIGVAAAGDVAAGAPNGAAGKTIPDDAPPKAIQVGYYKELKYARALADKLNAKGFMAQVEEEKAIQRYKVMVLIRPGQDPETLVLQLKDQGLEGFLVF